MFRLIQSHPVFPLDILRPEHQVTWTTLLGDARQGLANSDTSVDPPDERDLPPPPSASTNAGFASATATTSGGSYGHHGPPGIAGNHSGGDYVATPNTVGLGPQIELSCVVSFHAVVFDNRYTKSISAKYIGGLRMTPDVPWYFSSVVVTTITGVMELPEIMYNHSTATAEQHVNE